MEEKKWLGKMEHRLQCRREQLVLLPIGAYREFSSVVEQ